MTEGCILRPEAGNRDAVTSHESVNRDEGPADGDFCYRNRLDEYDALRECTNIAMSVKEGGATPPGGARVAVVPWAPPWHAIMRSSTRPSSRIVAAPVSDERVEDIVGGNEIPKLPGVY